MMAYARSTWFASVSLAAVLALHAPSALAGSTFLLQFGQHESKTEATAQWDALMKKNPDVLGNLSLRVAEVQLPPDGKTVYRTQAASFVDRDAAQDACTKLIPNLVDCLVVETSVYTGSPSKPSKPAAEASASAPAAPAAEEAMTLPELDVTEEEAAPASPTEEAISLEDAPALAVADAEKAAAAEEAPAPVAKSTSFKEKLMPWLNLSGDGEETEAKTAPVEPVKEIPAVESEAKAVEVPAEPITEAPPAPAPAPLPKATAAAPVDQERVVASQAPKNLMAPADASLSEEFAQAVANEGSNNAAVQPQLGSTKEGQVEVAEAIRVPLSVGNAAPAPTHKPVGYGGFPSQQLPGKPLWAQLTYFPNRQAAMEYWQQLSYQNPAVTNLLRARVIVPWKASRYSEPAASLRVGPFANADALAELCKVAAASKLNCVAVNDVGSSSAMTSGRARVAPGVQQPQRRMQAYGGTMGYRPSGMYWIQLGSFTSVPDAEERWAQLQSTHGDLLGSLQPQITSPGLSSSRAPVFHLRTGPYVNRVGAMNLCDSLQLRHMGCVVVQGQ